MSRNRLNVSAVASFSFLAGLALASLFRIADERRKKKRDRSNAGTGPEGNDFSLFWGDVDELTQTSSNKTSLPSDFYGKMVRDCVVCCVDCLIVRFNPLIKQKECLLVERASEPVRGVWWFPGGRLFKGETFFQGAVRKVREETGLDNATPVQVLGFYNTFFPTSHWDTEAEKGTQTVQPIVLVELQEGSEILLDQTSERYRWIGLDPEEAKANGEDKYVTSALLRLQAWNSTYGELSRPV